MGSEDELINIQWRNVVRARIMRLQQRIDELQQRASNAASQPAPAVASRHPDVPGMVSKIQAQRHSLERATKTLNEELEKRHQRGPTINGKPGYIVNPDDGHWLPNSDGTLAGAAEESCGAALYNSWEQTRILEEEVDKLRADLRSCRERPDQYQPGCEEDLSFQITRLKQETERRIALAAEQHRHVTEKVEKAGKALRKCQDQSGGCPPDEEQPLRLEVKKFQECADIHERHENEVSWRKIYSCLWKYRDAGNIHEIERWFTVPKLDVTSGCRHMKPLKGNSELAGLGQCLCEQWNAVETLETEAAVREHQAMVKAKVAAAQEKHRATARANREKEEAAASKAAVEKLLYHEMEKEGSLSSTLKKAMSSGSGREVAATAMTTAKRQMRKQTQLQQHKCGEPGDDGADCEKVKPGAGVDKAKLDSCLPISDSDAVKSNIRKAFEVGNLRTGCALLSLATNAVLQSIHDCMCGATTSGEGTNGANLAAVAGTMKTLTDVPLQRFRAVKQQLRGVRDS